MDIRTIEKNDKWGYMFYIKYDEQSPIPLMR